MVGVIANFVKGYIQINILCLCLDKTRLSNVLKLDPALSFHIFLGEKKGEGGCQK